jgi:hypothetical protein
LKGTDERRLAVVNLHPIRTRKQDMSQHILRRLTSYFRRDRKAAAPAARPGLEPLEDRFAPAVFNVNSLADVLNPAPGVVTLRSAIQAALSVSFGRPSRLVW